MILTAAAIAQQPASAAPTQSSADTRPVGVITIPAGTEIPLKLAQAISTRNAKPGDPVYA
ncbi:MAG: hypothetical protein ACRD3E_11180 [Terriglobales bacterium]